MRIRNTSDGGERVVFIAGPTASGKSAAALALAVECGGEIVNADAMQVYADLRVVTARPSGKDEASVPHHLYGVMDGAEACSAGRWAQMALEAINEINARNKIAIVTGGTGLYFKALEEGLSPIPDVPVEAREKAVQRREELGAAAFREEVISNDPAMERLPEGDTQRLLRAWEVFNATGKPLSYFQEMPRQPLIERVAKKLTLAPSREQLYENCNTRAETMLEEGAVEEVRALMARGLDAGLPVMKALGVPEIAAFILGDMDCQSALRTLQQNTRRFAKRQMTWFRNQAADWPVVETPTEAVSVMTG